MTIRTIPLNDGTSIPWLGFGTGTALHSKDCTTPALNALRAGFTHLDCAQRYRNEKNLGGAIIRSGVPRERLFVTTKLAELAPGETVEQSVRASLARLKLSYVDMLLIHVPSYHEDREGDGVKGVWREMVEVKKQGLTRSIGVSNFSKKQLEEIIELGLDKPAVNQIEYHLLVAQSRARLLEYSNAQGIVTESYAGLTPILESRTGPNDSVGSLAEVCTNIAKTIDKLAASRGSDETLNQIMLKWLKAKGVVALTTTTKEERLKDALAADLLPDLTLDEIKELEDSTGGIFFSNWPAFKHVDEGSQY